MKKEKEKEKIVCISPCTKQYFTSVNTAQNSISNTRYPGYAMILLCLMFGMYMMQSGENYIVALLLYFFGIIVIPIGTFIIPYNVRRRRYNKLVSEEKPLEVKAEFDDRKFRIRNYDGSDSTYQYRSIVSITVYGDILIIRTGDNRRYYLELNGFRDLTETEVLGFLKSHTGIEDIEIKSRRSALKVED